MAQLKIALLSYRSNPHVGGQGIYLRHLSRELTALGHRVEVFSGQPYPELDPGVHLTKVPSMDLFAEPNPFRNPRPSEFRDRIDVEEWARMRTGAFPEPLTFARRVVKLLRARASEFEPEPEPEGLLMKIGDEWVPTLAMDTTVDMQVSGLLAEVTVRQTYRNDASEWREGRYLKLLVLSVKPW